MEFAATRREVVRAALLGAGAALLVAVLAPPGGDSAAHLYRTMLVRDGVHVWDNLWYGGQYPLASYSLLYYLPASVVGNVPLVVAATVASAALFAALVLREWGDAARWPARVFAVLAAGPLFTGTYTYALGVAAGLGALVLLQRGRTWLTVGCAALALGFSPLAFAFLCVALGAIVVARRRLGASGSRVAVALAVLAGLQLLAILVFPTEGRYPFNPLSLAAVLTVSALGALVASRSEQGRVLVAFFALWGLVNLVAFFVPSPFGDNLTRLRGVVFALVLLSAAVARFRPGWLAGGALAFALFYNLAPDVSALPKRTADTKTAEAAFWAPALDFVRARSNGEHRVEVVPTFGHWEAYWVPRAGLALARGWYRQIDLAENPELYRRPLDAEEYVRWLRRLGVRFVLLPEARLGPMGAEREAELLRSGRAGLVQVFRSRDWTIYELPDAPRILTGPAPARIDRLGHDVISGRVERPGTYTLRVRYTPYWDVAAGRVCLAAADDRMTRLVVRRGGAFHLVLPERPATLLRKIVLPAEPRC